MGSEDERAIIRTVYLFWGEQPSRKRIPSQENKSQTCGSRYNTAFHKSRREYMCSQECQSKQSTVADSAALTRTGGNWQSGGNDDSGTDHEEHDAAMPVAGCRSELWTRWMHGARMRSRYEKHDSGGGDGSETKEMWGW